MQPNTVAMKLQKSLPETSSDVQHLADLADGAVKHNARHSGDDQLCGTAERTGGLPDFFMMIRLHLLTNNDGVRDAHCSWISARTCVVPTLN